ncbi:hypothetical protein H4Q26_017468 [Puccinia striiformis f. sp. tritici PST-130]|nr:hypothetical protein H4Q26_017468 [Puccinia striiformis f. sp. tritici PST-130]
MSCLHKVYFDQAVTTAKLLNIKQGETQFSGEVYPCTRFPLSSLQKHLETLLIKHRRVVAISEEEISSDEDGEIRRTFRIIRPASQKTTPAETKKTTSLEPKKTSVPEPAKQPLQKRSRMQLLGRVWNYCPSLRRKEPKRRRRSLLIREIPKFVLDSRLRFPHAVLLTCVGSFYEVYFDQAVEVAELLNIKQGKTQFSGYAYPFTGFPLSSLQRNLKTLVNEHNRVVAIAEEEPRPMRRLKEDCSDYYTWHHPWLDVSTGSYFQTTCDGGESELLDQFSSSLSNQGLTAEVLIAIYIKRNLLPVRAATRPLCVDALRHLKLDAEAIDSLEIIRTQNGKSEAGSLLSTISRTLTSPGKDYFAIESVMSPSRVLAEIETRLDLVEKLVVNHTSREDIQDTLREIEDIDYFNSQRYNCPVPIRISPCPPRMLSDAIGDLTQASAAQAATENTSIEATKDFFSPVTGMYVSISAKN